MKKIFAITTCIIMLATTSLMAQGFSFGGKVGFIASSYNGDDAVDLELNKGATFGLFFNAPFLNIMAVQPELLFKQNGAYTDIGGTGVKQRIKVNYLQVPVVFKLGIPIDGTFYPHILLGPQFSYAVTRTYSVEGGNSSLEFEDADIRKTDAGGFFGLGMDVRSDRFFWTIDFRYGLGAFNISNDDNVDLDLRNEDFSVATGFGVTFGK